MLYYKKLKLIKCMFSFHTVFLTVYRVHPYSAVLLYNYSVLFVPVNLEDPFAALHGIFSYADSVKGLNTTFWLKFLL